MARRQADDQPPDMPLAHRGQLGRDELEMPVRRKRSARVQLTESASGKARKIVPQQGGALARRGITGDLRQDRHGQPGGSAMPSARSSAALAASAVSAAIWRRKRATNNSTTSRSGAVKAAGSGDDAVPAFSSTAFSMSNSIFVARKSASADLSTICLMIASRLVILRRCPSIVV